jgi:hypothetical protein
MLDQFEPSRELSLAKTKLDELEMWLERATPKNGQPALVDQEPEEPSPLRSLDESRAN